MDREAWRAAVHGVTKNCTRLSDRTELILSEIYDLILSKLFKSHLFILIIYITKSVYIIA